MIPHIAAIPREELITPIGKQNAVTGCPQIRSKAKIFLITPLYRVTKKTPAYRSFLMGANGLEPSTSSV
jgi:hypothetical protein